MFFALSKILGFFSFPSTLLVSAGLLGIALLLTRWRRTGTALMAMALIGLLVLGLSPVSILMMSPLTERFPAWQFDGRDPDGVIVLGGAIDANISAERGSVELSSAAERVVAMLELAQRFPNARIVFSGGSGNLVSRELPEAPAAKALLETFQHRGDRFVFEDGARTTFENATHTKALVSPKPAKRGCL